MDDFTHSGLYQITPSDVYLIMSSIRFSGTYWNEIHENDPKDEEAKEMVQAFATLIEKVDSLEEYFMSQEFEDYEAEDEVEVEQPNNVLQFRRRKSAGESLEE